MNTNSPFKNSVCGGCKAPIAVTRKVFAIDGGVPLATIFNLDGASVIVVTGEFGEDELHLICSKCAKLVNS